MFYEDLKQLRPGEFKRYCGVKPKTFERMVAAVGGYQEKRRRKSGRPPKLSLADQILLTLEYWCEYRTFFHLGKSWGLHESSVCRIVQRVETILTKSKAFALPGKKRLQQADHTIEAVIVDASETPIERPKKTAALLQRQEEAPHTEKPSGNQSPEKKPRGQELAPEAKRRNRELARLRIVIEHVIRHLKIFRILAERYRNRRRRFSLRFNLIAGLFNFELNLN